MERKRQHDKKSNSTGATTDETMKHKQLIRREQIKIAVSNKRKRETEEETKKRLEKNKLKTAETRKNHTEEETNTRLEKDKVKKAETRKMKLKRKQR